MKKEHIWIAVAIVLALVVLGLVAGWAWSAGAAAAGAAAAVRMAAEIADRNKSRAIVVSAEEDVEDALEEVSEIPSKIDLGTIEIEGEIADMTPSEKIALAKDLLGRVDS